MPQGEKLSARRRVAPGLARDVVGVLAVAVVLASALFGYFAYLAWGHGLDEPGSAAVEEPPSEPLTDKDFPSPDVIVRFPPIRRPPTLPADQARLRDEDLVIGVCVNGRARAYLVSAMGGLPRRHVVNDVVGGRGLSVTYCDRTHCSHVFSGGAGADMPSIEVGGWMSQGLSLRVGETYFSQKTGERLSEEGPEHIPYPEYPSVQTTWKLWHAAHPDTDVYVGGQAAEHDMFHAE